jgi:hypothetical protein
VIRRISMKSCEYRVPLPRHFRRTSVRAPSPSTHHSFGYISVSIHSSALLLPNGSVMTVGSNPNIDVNLTTVCSTTYTAEYFYPPYFSAKTRPVPQISPTMLSYGGNHFDVTIPSTSHFGSANDAGQHDNMVINNPAWIHYASNEHGPADSTAESYVHGGIEWGQSFSIHPNFRLILTCFNRDLLSYP